jgi:hypothetical protein
MRRSRLLVGTCLLAFAAATPIQANATSLEDIAAQLARIEKDSAERIGKLEKENAALRRKVDILASQSKLIDGRARVTEPGSHAEMVQTASPKIDALVIAGSTAMAADMPVKSRVSAPMISPGGFYVWGDGSYQSIQLPTYPSVGFGTGQLLAGSPLGSVTNFHDRLPGDGFSGALGYQFPYNSVFGSEIRLEVGGSYVHSTATQSTGNVPFGAGNSLIVLDGTTGFVGLGPGTVRSNLTTDYTVWQVNGKLSGDFRFNALTLTPSVAIFRNDGRNNQNLSQILIAAATDTYQANTQLKWTDWGARIGLDAKYRFTDWIAAGIGGYVGSAERNVAMSGSDVSTLVASSAVASGARTTAFLANAEAKLIFTPISTVEIKGFAGLNFDNRVAGISSPNFIGNIPADIKFEAETSYYVGGGVTAKFFPEGGTKY